MSNFKDNFSKQSDIYVRYRPHYPVELYSYLASLTNNHELAWDCGTGNGQAAAGLTAFYNKVIATDPSTQQIKNALPDKKINYLVEKAENTSIASGSVDLLTIANALHWFDFDLFYEEVKRVLKRDGIIAAWAYQSPSVSPEIDKLVKHLHDDILGNYWLAENRLVENEYKTIPFPFQLINSPVFFSEKRMNFDDFITFLATWSATQRFIDQNNFSPSEQIKDDLKKTWGDNHSEKKVIWQLTLKVGRISTPG